MIETFEKWYKNRHEYAKEWKKKTGGKIIGYFCTYVPEEILYAANIFPVRILGSHEPQNVTEPHIFGMFCPFCRDCLAQGLQGRYDYLDGIMIAQSCLHIRQAYSSWSIHKSPEFTYYLPMPHNIQSNHSIPFLNTELNTFKKKIEEWTGQKITNNDLDRGIQIMNENRMIMKTLYNIRKKNPSPINGLESMYITASSQLTDKREHTAILKELISKKIPSNKSISKDKTRLMIIGSENDDIEFIEMVEKLNATVVIDDHCTGSRYFWNQVILEKDRLLSIAKRYISRPSCPTKDWPKRTRLPHVLNLAKEWNVKGAVIIQQKFCDPHELDIPEQRKNLESAGIPCLLLELDVTVPIGQFKIRLEAFLEMLREEDLF